ncbi:MAG: hypothetical protein NVS4B8_25260 [Herpetosiphon sp.]
MSDSFITEARERALEIMHKCATPYGFRASALSSGYPQTWARDSVITLLGAAATADPELIRAGGTSLEMMSTYQSGLGLIQLNVNPDSGAVSTENAGAVDSNLWFILGHYVYFKQTGDIAFLTRHWSNIVRALIWVEYQDMNACGLLEVPEAGNWMDLLAVHYNTLYDNVLYYAAVLAYEEMAKQRPHTPPSHTPLIDAAGIHERLNMLMWVDRCWVPDHFAEHLERLKTMRLEWFMVYHNIGTISSRPFYLPWVAFREYGDWCDSLGNLLAILTGVADGQRAAEILRYMDQVGMADPFPTKAIYPPIYPGERDWRDYYRSRNLNLPHQYHNGGIWPMIGGFHVAALVARGRTSAAQQLLGRLAQANRQGLDGEWEFNEWLHGERGRPMGYAQQAWSAAMFLYAEQAVRTGGLPLFQDLLSAKPATAVAREVNTVPIRAGGGPC